MTWFDDDYIRKHLDARERWGTLMSLTAIAVLLHFLSEHRHRSWANLAPVVIGACGFFYLLVVNSYYKQAYALSKAREESNKEEEARILAAGWRAYTSSVGMLGWCHIFAPIVLAVFATLMLYFGILPTPQAITE